MKTGKKNRRKTETAKNESNLGFKKGIKGILGKFVSKKEANINKIKAKKRKTEDPPKVFPTGVDGQKQTKHGILKGETKGKLGKKQNRKKIRILKTGLLGEQAGKNLLKFQENCRFGPFNKPKEQKHRKKIQNHQTPPKKQLFACWQTTPYFWQFLFNLHS